MVYAQAADVAQVEQPEEQVLEHELTEEELAYNNWALGLWEKFDRQQGRIVLPGANATLDVPESFYFLGAEDAKTVLEEVWGNPPGQDVLGMLFPAESTPFDAGGWGATIEYLDEGYVSDEDAAEINYDELLQSMQNDTESESEARVAAGYEPIKLVGWASSPYYDHAAHKLHWAQELEFGDMDVNTLNYNIRVLGRKGLLRINFIADMGQLNTIQENVDTVLGLAEFDTGATYAEFDPSMDKVAAYGIGALVAGKVIAKTGFLAAALVFLKKFGVIILLGVGAFLARIFKKKPKDEETDSA